MENNANHPLMIPKTTVDLYQRIATTRWKCRRIVNRDAKQYIVPDKEHPCLVDEEITLVEFFTELDYPRRPLVLRLAIAGQSISS